MKTISQFLVAGATLALSACSFEVTNPGPVQDEFLNLAEAHQALVNGAGRRLAEATSYIGYTGALAAREIFPGGQTGNGGHSPSGQAGRLLESEVGNQWRAAQQSRWIAEDAIRRFTQVVPAGEVAPQVLAQAYLWAGYANRILGENMCEAVFNGGPAEPNAKYFERAAAAFTEAINKGSGNVKTAAYAGRASVRVWQKDWNGAASDAQQVPLAFTNTAARAIEDVATGGNDIYYANANAPYRGYSIWRTYYESYYEQTGDPRAAWKRDAAFPYANQQLSGYGRVPWLVQTKYKTPNDPYRLSTGREMVLIRAEALLEQTQWQEAMTLINSLRTSIISATTGKALDPWAATSLNEAWTFLKRERGIELWLEARRLGDIRRWAAKQTPAGVLDWPNFEAVSVLFKNNPPSNCFPIPTTERDTNPNL